jgi:hypothetical protein
VDPTQHRILLDLARDYRDKIKGAAAHMHNMCDIADLPDEIVLNAIARVNLLFVVEITDEFTDTSVEDFAVTCAVVLRDRRATSKRKRRCEQA